MRLDKISDIELLIEFENRKQMALEIKKLRTDLSNANKLIEFVKNASAPAVKGSVLEMVSRKVQVYLKGASND